MLYLFSRQMRLLGETGGDVSLEVPVGVTVLTDSGEVIADLCRSGDKVVVAKGDIFLIQTLPKLY